MNAPAFFLRVSFISIIIFLSVTELRKNSKWMENYSFSLSTQLSTSSIVVQQQYQQNCSKHTNNNNTFMNDTVWKQEQMKKEETTNQNVLTQLQILTRRRNETLKCPEPLVPYKNKIVPINQTEQRFIPKILHLSTKSKCIPRDIEEYIDRWSEKLPNYSIFLHDDEAVQYLIQESWNDFPNLKRAMNCVFYKGAMTIDIWRILVLYKYGGVYSDIDNWAGNELKEEVIPYNVTGFTFSDVWNRPSQWFMAFEPRHPLMYLTMKQIILNVLSLEDVYHPPLVFSTGPAALNDAYIVFMSKDDVQGTIHARGYHKGAFGHWMYKESWSKANDGDPLINIGGWQGNHSWNDLVEGPNGNNITRRERIEALTQMVHHRKQRNNNMRGRKSCAQVLKEIDEKKRQDLHFYDKNGHNRFGVTKKVWLIIKLSPTDKKGNVIVILKWNIDIIAIRIQWQMASS
jgi:Mannosyltransferase OCH1 and related enzymes